MLYGVLGASPPHLLARADPRVVISGSVVFSGLSCHAPAKYMLVVQYNLQCRSASAIIGSWLSVCLWMGLFWAPPRRVLASAPRLTRLVDEVNAQSSWKSWWIT